VLAGLSRGEGGGIQGKVVIVRRRLAFCRGMRASVGNGTVVWWKAAHGALSGNLLK
jgi:hypothetical protein